jgi:hypothetical protein
MMSRFLAMAGALLAVVLIAPGAASAAGLYLQPISGPTGGALFTSPAGADAGGGPSDLVSPPGDTHRTFVATRDGYVYVIVDGVTQPTPFLDLHARIDTLDANGLFSMAFDPDYASNRRFSVMFSDTATKPSQNGESFPGLETERVLSFQTRADDPNHADASSVQEIISIPPPDCTDSGGTIFPPNIAHYGGQIAFDPEGNLLISVGDGGDGCAAYLQALDLTNLRGKLLRITPGSTGSSYTVPSDNPLVGQGGGVKPEIIGYGLRNPYRFSIDTGGSSAQVVLGDVGNNLQEEIDAFPAAPPVGQPRFFGWGCYEGNLTVNAAGSNPCPVSQTPTAPVLTRDHAGSCTSVTGGMVLRDPSLGGDYTGRYLFSYWCATAGGASANVGSVLQTADLGATTPVARLEGVAATPDRSTPGFGLASFGVDGCQHPYALNVGAGLVYRVEGPTPGPCGQYTPPQTTLGTTPASLSSQTTASVSFTSSVRGSSFTCQLDGGAAEACTSPKTYTGLSSAAHTVAVAATDEAGNADATPATASFVVDAQAPTTTITSAPSGVVKTTAASIQFAADEPAATFTCAVDDRIAVPCTSPLALSDLAIGAHKVAIVATDAIGNVAATPVVASWQVAVADNPGGGLAVPPVAVPPVAVPPVPVLQIRFQAVRSIRLSATGTIAFRLGIFPVQVTGTATLTGGGHRLAAAKRFTGVAGKKVTLKIKLSKAARAKLRAGHQVTAKVRIVVKATDGRTVISAATFTFRPPRKR